MTLAEWTTRWEKNPDVLNPRTEQTKLKSCQFLNLKDDYVRLACWEFQHLSDYVLTGNNHNGLLTVRQLEIDFD